AGGDYRLPAPLFGRGFAATGPYPSFFVHIAMVSSSASASLALLLLSPLFLFVLLAIRLGTGGPTFSVERAYRCNNQPISVLRFRTRDHGSVNAFGPLLTRSGLDQLPMLISVLRGELSIVGPHRYVLPPLRIYDQVSPAFSNAPFLPGLVSFELPLPAGGEI